jgi:hypothetical protein
MATAELMTEKEATFGTSSTVTRFLDSLQQKTRPD